MSGCKEHGKDYLFELGIEPNLATVCLLCTVSSLEGDEDLVEAERSQDIINRINEQFKL